jgi:hypothetical protein
MNENEFDRTARAWLDDGPTRMSDRAVLSALEEIHTTRQRRAWWPARRATSVNIYARAAIAAVLVVGVGFVAVNVLRQPGGSSVGGQATASPFQSASPPLSPAPSAADIPELTQTYVSSLNGFSIGYPDGFEIQAATEVWNPRVNQEDYAQFDFMSNPPLAFFRGSSTEVPDGVSVDEWVDLSVVHYEPGSSCGAPRSELPEFTIDGQSGRITLDCPGEIEATVVVGGRLYLFTLGSDASNSREIFDAWASTIDLRPEEAASPAPA